MKKTNTSVDIRAGRSERILLTDLLGPGSVFAVHTGKVLEGSAAGFVDVTVRAYVPGTDRPIPILVAELGVAGGWIPPADGRSYTWTEPSVLPPSGYPVFYVFSAIGSYRDLEVEIEVSVGTIPNAATLKTGVVCHAADPRRVL